VSVRLSPSLTAAARGGFAAVDRLWGRQVEDIDRVLHGRRRSSTAPIAANAGSATFSAYV